MRSLLGRRLLAAAMPLLAPALVTRPRTASKQERAMFQAASAVKVTTRGLPPPTNARPCSISSFRVVMTMLPPPSTASSRLTPRMGSAR